MVEEDAGNRTVSSYTSLKSREVLRLKQISIYMYVCMYYNHTCMYIYSNGNTLSSWSRPIASNHTIYKGHNESSDKHNWVMSRCMVEIMYMECQNGLWWQASRLLHVRSLSPVYSEDVLYTGGFSLSEASALPHLLRILCKPLQVIPLQRQCLGVDRVEDM